MKKIIIAGSRDFNDYEFLKKKLVNLRDLFIDDDVIISGHARGADALGERFAKEYNIPLKLFPADWNKYGKSAGYIRNKEMADNADVLVAFWDGKSRGTKNMINIAIDKGLEVHIVRYA